MKNNLIVIAGPPACGKSFFLSRLKAKDIDFGKIIELDLSSNIQYLLLRDLIKKKSQNLKI